MRAMLAALVTLSLVAPALAAGVEGTAVMYVGGTVSNVTEGQVGRLDTTVDRSLLFEYGSSRVEIPYAMIKLKRTTRNGPSQSSLEVSTNSFRRSCNGTAESSITAAPIMTKAISERCEPTSIRRSRVI